MESAKRMKDNNILRKNKGFTLLEVMIAVTILACGILAVGSMQISSVESNSDAGNTTEATTVAEDTLERLLGLPYGHDDLLDDPPGPTPDLNVLRNPLPALPAPPIPDLNARPPEYQQQIGKYLVCWNVENGLVLPNTKTINVIVVWNSGSEQKAVLLEYIRAQDNLFL